jgi:hypothetical protein
MKTMFGILGLLAVGATAAAFTALHAGGDDPAALVKALARASTRSPRAFQQVSKPPEVALSAKYEFDDKGQLSLSIYTAAKGLSVDAEHNVLKEYSGSPEQAAWTPEVEVFEDVAHVARSAQQQTLVALSSKSLLDVIALAEKTKQGRVVSIKPVLEGREAHYTVRIVVGDKVVDTKYALLDEEGEEHGKH